MAFLNKCEHEEEHYNPFQEIDDFVGLGQQED